MIKYLKNNCVTVIVIAAGIACMAPSISQYQPVEVGGDIDLNMHITNNNNGTTYDSADMDIDIILSDVADKIIQYNSDYSTNTKEEIFAEWGYGVRGPPSGEISSGWGCNINSDTLEIRHGPFGYTEWESTNQDPAHDMMGLTISIPKSQLDYNHDGIFSNAVEGITLTTVDKPNAFTAITPSETQYKASMKAYAANIPEPFYLLFIIYQLLFIIYTRRSSF